MALPAAEIGVFGGTGFYRFLAGLEEVLVQTPCRATACTTSSPPTA